jgi:dihydrofolate reductase
MKTILLVAYDDNKLIGRGTGKLPWNSPEDLKLFKQRTTGHTVVFGLNTYNGLPHKPLKGRVNIVVTPEYLEIPVLPRDTVLIPACGVKNAIETSKCLYPSKTVFICGGASIYKQALEQGLVDEMHVSLIPGDHEGDVYFPEVPGNWSQTTSSNGNFSIQHWIKNC